MGKPFRRCGSIMTSKILFLVILLMTWVCLSPAFAVETAENVILTEIRNEIGNKVDSNQIKAVTISLKKIKDSAALNDMDSKALKRLLTEEAQKSEESVDAVPQAEMLLEAVRLFPQDLRLRVKLSKALIGMAQLQLAIQNLLSPGSPALEKATDGKGGFAVKDPEAKIVSYAIHGNGVYRAGKVEEARKFYQKAIEEDPEWSGAYFLMGALELGQGRLEEAKKYLNRALELNPENEGAKTVLKMAD